jgi:hypothetical protein
MLADGAEEKPAERNTWKNVPLEGTGVPLAKANMALQDPGIPWRHKAGGGSFTEWPGAFIKPLLFLRSFLFPALQRS